MKKKLLVFCLSIGFLNADLTSTTLPVLMQSLRTSIRQLEQLSQQVKLATENLDQIKTLNNTLNSVENGLDSLKLSVYNPVEGIKRIQRNAENLTRRMQDLGEKLSNLTPMDFLKEDAEFQDCLTMIQGKDGKQYATVNAGLNPYWERIQQETERQKKEVEEIHKTTGITLPVLQIKTCIDNRLSGFSPKLAEDIEELKLALKRNDREAYGEILKKISDDFKDVKRNQNKIIRNSINEIRIQRASLNENNKKWLEQLETFNKSLKESASKKKAQSTNDLLLEIANILHFMATLQLNQYNLSVKANNLIAQNMLMAGSERFNGELLNELKDDKNDKKKKTKYVNEFEEELKKYDIEYNALGIPIFN